MAGGQGYVPVPTGQGLMGMAPELALAGTEILTLSNFAFNLHGMQGRDMPSAVLSLQFEASSFVGYHSECSVRLCTYQMVHDYLDDFQLN